LISTAHENVPYECDPFHATNASMHSLIGQFVKFFLLIG